MKKTFALIALVSASNALAGVPGSPVLRGLPAVGPSPIDSLSCQGMKQGDYVTLGATEAQDELAFKRSEPMGGMLPAFKPVEEITYSVESLQLQGQGFRAVLSAQVMFPGSGSQTAVLEYDPSKSAADEANSKLTVHVSTFDESRGQRVETDTVYLLDCSTHIVNR